MTHQTVTQDSGIDTGRATVLSPFTTSRRGLVARLCTGGAVAVMALALLSGRSQAAIESNGLRAHNGLSTINGMKVHNGLSTINGMKVHNGLSTINGMKVHNGLSAMNGMKVHNGLSTINGMKVHNGLTMNGLRAHNGLKVRRSLAFARLWTANGIDPSAPLSGAVKSDRT
jgi:hypothetical protein